MTTQERRQEALQRAINPLGPWTNYPVIINGFVAKGIPETDIRPRENVFTYGAWKALGRQVRRGEHGVKVVTFITVDDAKNDAGAAQDAQSDTQEPQTARKPAKHSRPWTTTVFHVSQTDPINVKQSA